MKQKLNINLLEIEGYPVLIFGSKSNFVCNLLIFRSPEGLDRNKTGKGGRTSN
jgi:hypothetical protein